MTICGEQNRVHRKPVTEVEFLYQHLASPEVCLTLIRNSVWLHHLVGTTDTSSVVSTKIFSPSLGKVKFQWNCGIQCGIPLWPCSFGHRSAVLLLAATAFRTVDHHIQIESVSYRYENMQCPRMSLNFWERYKQWAQNCHTLHRLMPSFRDS